MTQVLLFFHLLSKFQGFVFQFGHRKKGHSYYKELFHNYSTSLLYENKCRVFQEWCEKSCTLSQSVILGSQSGQIQHL